MIGLRRRLIFGTGRLAGGAYARRSRGMIEACLKGGVVRFDTAPSYGLGAAETLLGDVVGPLDGVSIATKLGSSRPDWPHLRGWAKAVRELLPRGGARLDMAMVRHAGPPPGMDYAPAVLRNSLERSLKHLRRDAVDLLLLHEAEPAEVSAESWTVLAEALSAGQASALGFGHFGPVRAEQGGIVAQVAPWPRDFANGAPVPRNFHSVLRGARAAGMEGELAAVAARYGLQREGAAGEYLAALIMLARLWPQAGLIFATSEPERLTQLLALLDRIEAQFEDGE